MIVRSISSFAHEFETIVSEILVAAGFRLRPVNPGKDSGFDLEGYDPDGKKVAVQIKFFRTQKPGFNLINRILKSVTDQAAMAAKDRAILVVTEIGRLRLFETGFLTPFQVFDVADLQNLGSKTPDLVERLNELMRVSRLESVEPTNDPIAPDPISPDDSVSRINTIIAEHEACPQSDGKPYERICTKAIAELFGDQLGILHEQHGVENGFHFLDLIASIKPSQPSNFWAHLRSDFRSRYIVFEFKNYKDGITQDQIYSTEKYLFTHALRTVAIVVARNGEAASARHAREGALREMGKLMIGVSGAELVKMLEMKRDLEDFTSVLADLLDDMLTTLGR